MRIAFSLPFEVQERLSTDALRHGHKIVAHCSTARELVSRIGATTPEVAIVAATERHLTRDLVSACDESGVRIVVLAGTEQDRRRAHDFELHETVTLDARWPDLESELIVIPDRLAGRAAPERTPAGPTAPGPPLDGPTLVAPTPAEPTPLDSSPVEAPAVSISEGQGMVVAVWGPAGAPGRTTIAINLAAELAATGKSVALADADTYSGSVAPALGMLDEAPGFAAACRLAAAGALDRAELERVGDYYGSTGGFWVLTGIGRPSRWPELSKPRVIGALKACREWVDITIVDIGFSLERDDETSNDLFAPARNAAGLAAIREADRVVAVGAADPVGLSRFLRAHVELLEIVDRDRILVAMNKLRAGAIGLNPIGQVAQTLSRFGGVQSAAMIPSDTAALDAAILAGRTLADTAPKSTARLAIRDLALSHLLDAPVVTARLRGRRPGRT